MKYSEIKQYREQLIKEQNGLCALCNHIIDNPVADHNHKTGHFRGALCRSCNIFLGKIENSRQICKITDEKLSQIANNLISYIDMKREEIHPLHNRIKRKKKSSLKKQKK